MPRTSFSAGMLGGAVPGLSKLAAALAGGGQAEQAGFDAQNMQQSKMAQALAQMEAAKASAALHQAQASEVQSKQRVLDGRPDLYEEQVAASSGTSLPLVQAIRNGIKTGTAPQLEMAGPTEGGGPLMGNIPADQQSNVMRAMREFLPLLSNSGDLKPDDLAQAANTFRNMNLSDRVIAGQADRNSVGGAQAAAAGKPLFNSDSNGAVLDQYGGQYDTSNPMAGATISLKGAQAGQAKAAAANQYAGADAHRANAEKLRFDVAQGGKPKYDPDRGVMVSPAGVATPVTLDGQPISPKSKSGPMSVTLQKELIESDDLVQSSMNTIRTLQAAKAINKQAYSGYLAKPRATLASNIPGIDTPSADATIQLDNMMTGQALESLKSIFGGAPTEGERAILLDIQASANKTPKQREEIMDRAIAAAQRRGVYATNKAKAIRSGKYLTEGQGIPEPAPAGVVAPAASGGFTYLGKEQ